MTFRAPVLLLLFAAATPNPHYFHFERPLVNTPAHPGQTCVLLDDAVFAHSGPNLASLRLYRGAVETPYAIDSARADAPPSQNIALMNKGSRGGATTFDAAMPEGPYQNLTLDMAAKDFIATVHVSGSQTQTSARPTNLGSYTIFDFTRQKLGHSTVLHLPPSDFRYLHFRIEGPIRPDQVTGLSASQPHPSKPEYLTFAASGSVVQKDRDSVVTISVPPYVPIDRVRISPGAQPVNFSRNVTITVAPSGQPRSTAAEEPQSPLSFSGNILRIHTTRNGHKIDEEDLAIDAPSYASSLQSQRTKWTIAIHNQDDTPIQLDSVELQTIARRLCFNSEPGAAYTLYYGDKALSPPRYDYEKLFVLDKNAATAHLGTEQQNPHYEGRPDTRPFTEKHPTLLWIVLIAAIAVLAAVALRSGRQIKEQ
ncbi:MAG TPA: DUF3999 family protein [Acidobacteriaceae bacterium]|nr:DUF3999 family protein [Acidobacteriaceae bacterium]